MKTKSAPPQRFLIVEDSVPLVEALCEALRAPGREIQSAGSVAAARAALRDLPPQLLLVDFSLPDGTGVEVVDAALELVPAPAIVAISGTAGPEDGFRLAERGVRAYVSKPIDAAKLERAVALALQTAPDWVPHVRASVGHRSLSALEEQLRRTMVSEAMAKAQGSRRRAASLLSVSRQFLQHVLRKQG